MVKVFPDLRKPRTPIRRKQMMQEMRNSNDITIKGNSFSGFVFPFDNTVFNESTGLAVPNLKFTKLHIN